MHCIILYISLFYPITFSRTAVPETFVRQFMCTGLTDITRTFSILWQLPNYFVIFVWCLLLFQKWQLFVRACVRACQWKARPTACGWWRLLSGGTTWTAVSICSRRRRRSLAASVALWRHCVTSRDHPGYAQVVIVSERSIKETGRLNVTRAPSVLGIIALVRSVGVVVLCYLWVDTRQKAERCISQSRTHWKNPLFIDVYQSVVPPIN